MTFVLTGTLSLPRGDYAAKIKATGGIVQEAVSKNTRYLVAGAEAGASKITKARSLGTAVLDEAGLLALLAGTSAPAAASEKPAPKPTISTCATVPFHQQELF